MDTPPTASGMGAAPEQPDADDASGMAEDESAGQPETATVPIDFCGQTPPQEGDIIKARVVSVDQDNGSMDIVCVPNAAPAARGIKAAVASMKGM